MISDIFKIRRTLKIVGKDNFYYSLPELQKQGFAIEKLPFSIRILLENALRNFDDFSVTKANIETFIGYKFSLARGKGLRCLVVLLPTI